MTTTVRDPLARLRDEVQADVLAAYEDHLPRDSWTRAQILEHQCVALRELLAHAAAHSPFHARRLADVDLDAITPSDLSALPVMTKPQMMDELDDVLTDRRFDRALLEETIASSRDDRPALAEGALVQMSGGSSGVRGIFVSDHSAQVQFVASVSRNLVRRLRAVGATPPGGVPIAMLAAASPVHPTGTGAAITAGGRLGFFFVNVPVTLPVAEIVARLNAMQPPLLFGYATAIANLAGEQRAGRLRIAPLAVTTSSEVLTPGDRAAIKEAFGAPIVNTFACAEGLVGSSEPDGEPIVFAEDGCIVELVDDRYRPVAPGTASHKVLATSLANWLQPLIRYELNDSFTALPGCDGPLRALVHGRSDEVLSYAAVTIHPHVVRSVLGRSPGVRDYRVEQTPDGIAVRVECDHGLDLAPLGAQMTDALAAAGLAAPRVLVERADEPLRDLRTGKLQRFVALRQV